MIHIDEHTVAVESEADLRTALGNDNGYYTVFLAVDITLTSGLTIYAGPNKPTLTIDGLFRNVTHSFTDMDSTLPDNTLYVNTASSIAMTFRNMIITGRNYYGVPRIYEFAATNNLSVTYDNVTYTGPQLAYNWNGLTSFIDCNITIQRNGVAVAQEVGEVNRVMLGGTTRIQHNTPDDHAVFYFHGSASTAALTVLENADVTVTSANNYFMYNSIPLISQIPVAYTVQPGASFTLSTSRGISYTNTHLVTSFLVDTNASFRYTQTTSTAYASMYVSGAFTVNPGASVYMQANFGGTAPLINFTTGTGSFKIDNPKSFVLYRLNAAALYFAASKSFSFTSGQLNYWSIAKTPIEYAGLLTDIAQRRWFKKDYAIPLALSGTAAQTSTTVTSDNLAAEDQPLPSLTDLHLHDAQVLSLGDLPLSVNPVVDDQTPITGLSAPNANILVDYTLEGTARSIPGTADDDGEFTVQTQEALPIGTSVMIYANVPFLITTKTMTSIYAGELRIDSAPERIRFITPPISAAPLLLRRSINSPVVILDTRVYSTQWELSALIDGPIRTLSGHTLPEGVVFVKAGTLEPLRSDVPLRVYVGGPDNQETSIAWDDSEGILLHVTESIYTNERYSTLLTWSLNPV